MIMIDHYKSDLFYAPYKISPQSICRWCSYIKSKSSQRKPGNKPIVAAFSTIAIFISIAMFVAVAIFLSVCVDHISNPGVLKEDQA